MAAKKKAKKATKKKSKKVTKRPKRSKAQIREAQADVERAFPGEVGDIFSSWIGLENPEDKPLRLPGKNEGQASFSADGSDTHVHVWFDQGVASDDFGNHVPNSGEWQVIVTTSPDPINQDPRGRELARETFRFADPRYRDQVYSSAQTYVRRALFRYRDRQSNAGTPNTTGVTVRIPEILFHELWALEVDTFAGPEESGEGRTNFVEAMESAEKVGLGHNITLNEAGVAYALSPNGALRQHTDIWADNSQMGNDMQDRIDARKYIAHSLKVIEKLQGPPEKRRSPKRNPTSAPPATATALVNKLKF